MTEAFTCPCCNRPVFVGSLAADPTLKMGRPGGQAKKWTWRPMGRGDLQFLIRHMRKRLALLESTLKQM